MNFYVYLNDQAQGPYPEEQVRQMLAAGQVTPETACCGEGDAEWRTVADFLGGAGTPAPGNAPANGPVAAVRFQHATYVIRRKVFKFLGGAFHIYDPQGQVAFYSEMKAFKLKEDIRLYDGEDKRNEVLVIKARQILDVSAAYDVVDPSTGAKVGVLKRRGLKSILKDEWVCMDANDQEIGLIQEDHLLLALIRRFVTNLLPQTYHGTVGGKPVCIFKQHFNPFVMKITLDFTPDPQGLLDRRLGLAAAVLLCAIEGRQD